MKKVLALFLVLFLLGVTVYWLGLPNLMINENEIGIIYTKSHGYELINDDTRNRWDARKLLPYNYKVLSFSQNFHTAPISIITELPQSELLRSTLQLEQNLNSDIFSLYLTGEISFRLRPSEIIVLLQQNQVLDNNLEQYYEQEILRINAFLQQELAQPVSLITQSLTQSKLLKTVQEEFPHLEIKHISINQLHLPSYDLYQLAKDRLTSSATKNQQYQEELLLQMHQIELDKQQKNLEWEAEIEKLEKIGALLSKYPILIAYMALMNELPADSPFVLPFLQGTLTMESESVKEDEQSF